MNEMKYAEYIESRQFQADCFEYVRDCDGCYSEESDDIIDQVEGFAIEDFQRFINRDYEGGLEAFARNNLEYHNR